MSNQASLKRAVRLTIVILAAGLIGGCFRGEPKEKPPIHLNPNMFKQPKYKAQSQSEFFTDGATMRQPVPGTIAADSLREDKAYYNGRDERDSLLAKMPVPVTMQLLKRGQERYNIYCAPCHGQTGDGQGIIVQRGYLPPPSYHQDRLRNVTDGYVFDVITNGVRNMPSYRHQIPVADRWAIVAYQRALQRSQDANINDIPLEMRESVK
jgi:mono/diheme cytochrome c family protein